MKAYTSLTEMGQIRRLRRLAEQVLQAYDLDEPRVRLLAHETNHLFRVDCADGSKYALRVCADEETTLEDNRAEAFWLQALQRDTDLPVVRLIPRVDGEPISIASAEGVPPARRCLLFGWVPGRDLEYQLSAAYYRQLGRITARMHEHASGLALPAGLNPRRWDRVFYFPNEEPVYHLPEYRRHFYSSRMRLMEAARELGEAALAELQRSGRRPMLIHGDLHYGNVKVQRGQLCLLDFENMLLGCPEQDVAITLYYGRTREDYADLVAAYRAGYTSVRPWPFESEAQLHSLMAARSVNFINYVAGRMENPEEMLPGMFQRLKQSLEIAVH